MFCKYCGTQLADGANRSFCPSCGHPIAPGAPQQPDPELTARMPAPPAAPQPQPANQPAAPRQPVPQYAPQQPAPQPQPQPAAPQPQPVRQYAPPTPAVQPEPPQQKKKSGTGLKILLAVLVFIFLAGIAAGVYFYFFADRDDADDDSETRRRSGLVTEVDGASEDSPEALPGEDVAADPADGPADVTEPGPEPAADDTTLESLEFDTGNTVPDEYQPHDSPPSVEDAIPFVRVSSSANQPAGSYGRTYTPDNAADGDPATCWMAAGGQGGAGNWIRFEFDGVKTVTGVALLNGNCWDGYYNGAQVGKDLYYINGRICSFTLTFSNGESVVLTANDVLSENFFDNLFYLPHPVDTSYIELRVDTGYVGSKWNTVVCLAEFRAF